MNARKRIGKLVALVLFATMTMAGTSSHAAIKYIFFLLGDGMASVQMQATEAYLTKKLGGDYDDPADMMANKLNMNQLPVQGMSTTFADGQFITDSAAAATAFACGSKTTVGTISMDSSHTHSLKSLAEIARDSGMKVGIISSVSIDHATPAAYYASVSSRGRYNEIAHQLANSEFNFFGGGGIKRPTGDAYTSYDIYAELAANGYTVLNTRTDIMNLQSSPMDKVVCINPWLQDSGAMPYAIDRDFTSSDDVSLAEYTETAIRCLVDSPNGFFIMVEGGKIDWACHANDAKAAIEDTLAFDDVVGVAMDFYTTHPNETLIVVTGDHECGGMTCGFKDTGYSSAYEVLEKQKVSFQYFNSDIWSVYKAANSAGFDPALNDIDNEADGEFIDVMSNYFGLVWVDMDAWEKERLEAAYDKSMSGFSANSPEEDNQLYGYYQPITVTLTHILNERAGIGWTSYSHTGVPVPVLAMGGYALYLNGFYDNTDIPKKIISAVGAALPLPTID